MSLKKISIALIVIGGIGIALNTIFGYNTITYLEMYRDPRSGLWFYKFNISAYINNLTSNLQVNLDEFLTLPTRQWIWNITIDNWWSVLTNNFAVILNWLFFIWNNGVGIFYHIGAWLLSNVLVILGMDLTRDYTGTGAWLLIEAIKFLRAGIFPYI